MGYENLPLEIECKILNDIDWTETVSCTQVCRRWRDYLSRFKAYNGRYVPGIHPPEAESRHIKRFKSRSESHTLHDFRIAMSEVTVSIAADEAEVDGNIGIIPQSSILGRTSSILLHRFVDESRHSFGFFMKVDSDSLSSPLRSSVIPQGFFLIGDQKLYLEANSLGARKGCLMLPEKLIENDNSSESSIDSEDEQPDLSFNKDGRFALQLNARWQWNEKVFNSPMCETEILYGRGFEIFKRVRRNFPHYPQQSDGKYLRRLSEPDLETDRPITIRRLVDVITRSVNTIKKLEPEVKAHGGVFFVKFNGVRIQEYMKYIPHGFWDFHTGGRIELEIYEDVKWKIAGM
ncbi:hypothetical protein TWF694_002098 [Orbilia ellipsospora]|uniref:F-box domain-containing protein n=1 Tax=Orbilia ellipsospora TaxID=2528407 RepID=A0AAV9X4S0_9PEZI